MLKSALMKVVLKPFQQGYITRLKCGALPACVHHYFHTNRRDLQNQINQMSTVKLPPELRIKLKNDKLDPDYLSNMLAKWLECSEDQAKTIVTTVPQLQETNLNSTRNLINLCKSYDVTPAMIQEAPWLFLFSLATIRERFHLLSQIGISWDTLPLLRVTTPRLAIIIAQWRADVAENKFGVFGNRLNYLAHHLDMTPNQLAMSVGKHYCLLTYDFHRINDILQLFLEAGISTTEIVENLWIFRKTVANLRKKDEIAKAAGLSPIKIWLYSLTDAEFDKCMEKNKVLADILGEHEDNLGYLASRLDCTKDYAECLAMRCPTLRASDSLPKIKANLDILYEYGISSNQICLVPRILLTNVALLQNRLKRLSEFNHKPPHLSVLCSRDKPFNDLINDLQRHLKKEGE